MKRSTDKLILGISLIGMLLALYALSLHTQSGSSICNIGETFNCDKVNKSVWSELFGIPVALLGVLSYLVVFLIVLKENAIMRLLAFTRRDVSMYLLLFVFVMLGFQVYLTIAEIFWIRAYCIICLLNQACVAAITWLCWKKYSSAK